MNEIIRFSYFIQFMKFMIGCNTKISFFRTSWHSITNNSKNNETLSLTIAIHHSLFNATHAIGEKKTIARISVWHSLNGCMQMLCSLLSFEKWRRKKRIRHIYESYIPSMKFLNAHTHIRIRIWNRNAMWSNVKRILREKKVFNDTQNHFNK